MNVIVDGLMTSYQKVGKGKLVVMLHGWEDGGKTFDALARTLKGKYTVLVVDLPGFGGTQVPPVAWDLDDYGKFVAAWLNKIGEKNLYGVIGHSNGGAISIRALSLGLVQPEKLVLLASAGIRDRHKTKRALLKAVSKSGKILTTPLPTQAKKKLRSKFYNRIGSDVGLYPQMEETFRKIISQDTQNDAKRIEVPTLLIYGQSDTSTPVLYGKIFNRQIKGSQLVVMPKVGHFLHQEKTAEIAETIQEFLDSGSK